VIDTNVLVGALLRAGGHNRQVIRSCLQGRLKPPIGQALFLEYEDVFHRERLFRESPLSPRERRQLLEAYLSTCAWVDVYYLWRPNLRDEDDNHILELAVAGGASTIVTNNVRDFQGVDLRFPEIRIATPRDLVKELL
jgi:putative PIN family toxin of toxin-antitoxin system